MAVIQHTVRPRSACDAGHVTTHDVPRTGPGRFPERGSDPVLQTPVAPVAAGAPTMGSAPPVPAATMAEIDRLAMTEFGIDLLQMMELAGSHLAEVASMELGGELRGRELVVAVGPGNNGGGGLAAARHLANRGARVHVVLARPALRMTDAGRHQLATLLMMDISCCVAAYDLGPGGLDALFQRADLIVDAILGYNGRGAPVGEVATLIASIADAARPVVSLDLPSGLDPDTGAVPGVAVTAAATLTLALPKTGLLRGDGPAHVGRLYLGDLGLPAALYDRLGIAVGAPFAAGPVVRLEFAA